ncbi:hypothetical protein [uncultured Anaerobiospirillum sp.]|uniref:hypothetical protein n=1 Tax=uncultured Anaerobiospirillum sp. TaxID=265728 RepID=UPI002804C814|nr:hypothetical protein [uncultured Anaerobiospirillum sp.]
MTESMVIVPEQAFKIRKHRNSKKNLTDVKVEMFQVVGKDVSSVKKLITIGELCEDHDNMMVPNAKYHELMTCVAQDSDHDDSLASGTKILYAGAEYISYPDCDEQLPLLAHAQATVQEAKIASAFATKKEQKSSPSTAKAKKGKAATASTQAHDEKAAASTRAQKKKSATASATAQEEKIAADFKSATDDDSASAQESSNVKVIIHSDLPETISKQVTENIKAKAKGGLVIKTAPLTPDASRSSNGYDNQFFNSDMYEDEDDDDDIYVPEYLDDDDDDDDDMFVSSFFDDDDDDDMYVSSLFDDDDYDYDDDDEEFLDPESIGGLLTKIRRENPEAFNFLELLAMEMKNHIEGKAGMPAKDVISKLNEIQIVQDEPGGEWHLSMQPTDEHFALFEKLGRSRKQVMDKLNNDLLKLNKKEKAKAKNTKPNRERRGKRRHK